jgi:hypothetical protein
VNLRAPIHRTPAASPLFAACRAALLFFLLAATILPLAYAQTDYDVARLTPLAEKGDATAQFQLGLHYYKGSGRREPPDYDQALKWFRLAADQGNAQAQDHVGLMYYLGKGVPRDYSEAARWYQLAAQAGNEHAQRQLAEMYSEGLGVPRDTQESKKWSRVVSEKHPDHSVLRIRLWFLSILLLLLAFACGLGALQTRKVSGWLRLPVGLLVHPLGIALVANSLVTYGFPIVFHNCLHNFLATACTQIADPQTRKIVNEIGDWSMFNLIWRFMAGVGLLLDILAAWYLVYLWLLFRRSPSPPPHPLNLPNAQAGPAPRLPVRS